jgi:hypothetical protein
VLLLTSFLGENWARNLANSHLTFGNRQHWVSISVVRFFFFERTSTPILTFKNLCNDSSEYKFEPVLPKFEPFSSVSITFFQIQEPLDLVFELGPV